MSGIDRLRTLAGAWDAYGLGGALEDVARQIERERACDADAIENIRLIVGGVVDEMERHILGHEGMEDSPVARWARELREALGGDVRDHAEDVSMSAYDLLPQEDRDAIAWVRYHGGLDAVKKLLDWVIGHCSTKQQLDFDFWLSGRVMHELGFEEDMADRDEVERRLLARLMPEGYEWPRYESGEHLRRESMPRAAYERKKAGFLDHIAECERALGRRNERIKELNRRACDLTREIAQMRPRLMPDGMCWPVFEDGGPVRPGDRLLDKGGDWFEATSFVFTCDWWSVRGYQTEGFGDLNDETRRKLEGMAYGTCVNRPAPKVLDSEGVECNVGDAVWWVHNKTGNFRIIRIEQDGKCAIHDDDADEPCGMTVPSTELTHKRPVLDADGAEIRVGDRVWSTQLDEPHEWIVIDPHGDRDDSQTVLVSIGDRTGRARPENLTHRAPVLAADGRPLREGETVWNVKTGERYVVGAFAGGCVNVSDGRGGGLQLLPAQLTHERPIADTWERLEEDADRTASLFDAFDSGASADIRDLVRRARALAGVPS